MNTPNTASLTAQLRHLGMSDAATKRVYSIFNAAAPASADAAGHAAPEPAADDPA